MKNYIILGMLLLAAMPMTFGQVGLARLNVELVNYDPAPAEAGKLLTLWFKVENTGFQTAKGVNLSLDVGYPFSLPNNDATRTFNTIGIGDNDFVLLEYKVLVDNNAPNETETVKMRYSYDGSSAVSEKEFPITIEERGDQAELKALFVSMEPRATPKSSTTLSLDIVNVDQGTAYFTIVSATSPAAVIERNEIFIGTLEPDDFDSADFDMKINDVPPGTYPVEITMQYKDIDSNDFETKDTVFINVAAPTGDGQTDQSPGIFILVYIIAAVVLLRLALPFIHWLLKPVKNMKIFKKK